MAFLTPDHIYIQHKIVENNHGGSKTKQEIEKQGQPEVILNSRPCNQFHNHISYFHIHQSYTNEIYIIIN